MNYDRERADYEQHCTEEMIRQRGPRRRKALGCLCGNPDWPGRCPGAAACPVQQGSIDGDEE